MTATKLPEPWLRGTLTEIPAVGRAVLHALELAQEDIQTWCGNLTDDELNARPDGIAPVAFHVRHIAGSMDRLLTYAEGHPLSAEQIGTMKAELAQLATKDTLLAELAVACQESARRVTALASTNLEAARGVGNKQLPTTVGGLLVHVADHTQRHVGQAIITAKIVVSQRQPQS